MSWSETQLFWYCTIGLQAILCLRLVVTRTSRVYARFTLFVASLLCESLLLALVLPHGNAVYIRVWAVSRLIVLTLELLAVVEIFSRSSDNFPGIETIGRKLFLTLFGGALLLTIATLPFDRRWNGWTVAIQITFVINREVHLVLAAFLLLMLAFFAYYGAPVAANLRRHAWFMSIFLTSSAIAYMMATRAHNIHVLNIILQAISLLCLSGWLVAFRPGENVRKPRIAMASETREMDAAEALNERLMVLSERITLRSLLGLAPKARPSGD